MKEKEEILDEDLVTEYEEDIEAYEKQRKKDRRDKIILIIIIIILLLLHLLCHKLGKIGYKKEVSTSSTDITANEPKVEFDVVEIIEGDVTEIKDSQLNIFNNKDFDGEKIIAPGSNGSYRFCVENLVDRNIKYDIKFTDEMTNPVNMKYRLKLDNVYVVGTEEKWEDIQNLNLNNVIVTKNSANVYT